MYIIRVWFSGLRVTYFYFFAQIRAFFLEIVRFRYFCMLYIIKTLLQSYYFGQSYVFSKKKKKQVVRDLILK